ncbi:TMCO4 family protein [Aspergillus udagawae]|uniref:Transmembrane and coiled-coil domain-containing protein 4 n=1 Tax=Aspergillus udagawae TaxID=91492 RepID=A0A8E0R138_9EURO|nr:uncharacterized protein Aud_010627 [Aspergillus udagawae]GIC94132.1 hypothetical protein Aud_010627 [Aspergillus udagawae]
MTSPSSAAIDHSVRQPASQASGDTQSSAASTLPNNDQTDEGRNGEAGVKTPEEKRPGGNPTLEDNKADADVAELDDFGLPIPVRPKAARRSEDESPEDDETIHDIEETQLPPKCETTSSEKDKPAASHDLSRENDRQSTPPPAYSSLDIHDSVQQSSPTHKRHSSLKPSEWSHQRLSENKEANLESDDESDGEWKEMPALGEFDVYDDFGRLVARGAKEEGDDAVYQGLGGAGKGYTRVQLDEDAQSATSLDQDTSYLFKEAAGNSVGVEEELRDPLSQLQATKDLLTESQRIAYVGVTRLEIYQMTQDLEKIPTTKASRKAKQKAADAMRKWGQTVMGRIYTHMEIDPAEQIMIEQLAEHGVQPADLVRPLMQNSRVRNPMADVLDSPKASMSSSASPGLRGNSRASLSTEPEGTSEPTSPPPYETHEDDDLPEVRTPSQMPTSAKIDIDLRWTVLCDLFLVLISDSAYDARSRSLLERVGKSMEVSWLQIARFEKRVIDALEMQEAAEKETWDESEHMEKRRKMALKRKYMVMGLATVGGGLIIGLSAGLLAPVIGAGLAAGFTTVGISGTSAFLGGAGGTALIASGATLTGSTIGLRASHRRTGAVQTFEYRPLHNNKRVNLIVAISGWMTGKVDDVRLPFSTVDPIMGDIYSVLWEPEMLQSMGATINILATEALTQGLQQVLGSTVLMALMASLQLPLVLTKLSYLIDNPWNVSLARANAAGLILADSLMDRNLGKRPVTLLGFSLGARVIFSCLKELADKGASGLIQNVYLFGSPLVANKDEFIKARSVVSGRFVNGYSSNDWILGYLFRATSGGIMRVAGIAPVEGIPGLENFDVTNLVNGHMDYRAAIPRLLKEVGWEVLSEEFAEIEDPDPENHGERQRELIREIDEARKAAEAQPEKKRFGLFKRGKLAEKKGWETYDAKRSDSFPRESTDSNGTGTVLFDIDAIRAELASEMIEVKQLESTLPPMKLDLNSPSTQSSAAGTPSEYRASKDGHATPSVPQTPVENSLGRSASQKTQSPPPHQEQLNMTFETSYDNPPQRSHSSFEPAAYDSYPTRPALRSSVTMPTSVGASALGVMALEPNAWADHEFSHGEEGEISMTFE